MAGFTMVLAFEVLAVTGVPIAIVGTGQIKAHKAIKIDGLRKFLVK
jgi:hypothetical protein